ncbi:hypothetical protein KY285_012825 [Solanum tuberosum]|nr:hypothetical protein KY285_012825 [Solanum tuberosum]
MNSAPPIGHSEGQSTVRPLMFNGSHFGWWRARIEDFIQADDYELWDRITMGPTIPMKTVERVHVPKDALVNAHKGTNQVRKFRVAMLFTEYETFKMKEGEPLLEMFTQLTKLMNELSSLGKILTTEEQVNKVLRILPKNKWDVKVTAIREAKDISIMTLDELVGNLRTYEMNMDELKKEEMLSENTLALKFSDGEDS